MFRTSMEHLETDPVPLGASHIPSHIPPRRCGGLSFKRPCASRRDTPHAPMVPRWRPRCATSYYPIEHWRHGGALVALRYTGPPNTHRPSRVDLPPPHAPRPRSPHPSAAPANDDTTVTRHGSRAAQPTCFLPSARPPRGAAGSRLEAVGRSARGACLRPDRTNGSPI